MAKTHIYQEIESFIKGAIEDGSIKAGEAIYSESLLCQKFNASRTSVRKAIRKMVEENLLASHQGKGTFVKSSGHGALHEAICIVNHWSRSMRADWSDTYFKDMILGAERSIYEKGSRCLIYSGVIDSAKTAAEKMAKMKVDGIILDGRYLDYMDDAVETFSKISPHVVVVDGNPEESKAFASAPDARPACAELLKLASARGGQIAFLCHEMNAAERWRNACFKKEAEAASLETSVLNYSDGVSFDNFMNLDHYPLVHRTLERWLSSGARHGASILCSSDHAAAKAVKALSCMGWRVPGDFAVSGFGGMAFGACVSPALTSVKADAPLMAEAAVELLFELIGGAKPQEPCRLCGSALIRRESL